MAAKFLATLRNAGNLLWALLKGRFRTTKARVESYPWEAAYPKGISWHLEIKPRPLFSLLEDSVAAHPNRPCLKFLGRRYTYKAVSQLVARAAKGFQVLGVRKGVKVGLCLPNSPYFVICFHAILKAGGTVVNFNPLYAEQEIARQIRDSETRIIVTMDLKSLYPKIKGRLADTCLEKIVICRMTSLLPFPRNLLFKLFKRREIATFPRDERHILFAKLNAQRGGGELPDINPEHDIAVLQYTGGKTGVPKGAMLTHFNLYANAVQVRTWATGIEIGAEKFLALLPLCHPFGMSGIMNFGISVGAEIILLPRFRVGELLRVISEERPSVLMGVPTIYSAMAADKDCKKYGVSSLKFCISGGAPLPLEVKKAFEQATGCTLIDGYGLTEASPVCTIGPVTDRNKPGSVGLPLPGTIIEVVSLKNPQKTLPPGVPGEICVSGPQVMAGYWKQEAETHAVLDRGRLRTGDIGYLDEEGSLFIVDRIKEMIITGGFKVYPRMVEEAIRLHPAVGEAMVRAIQNRHRGETVKAYVKLRPHARLTASELRAFLEDKLARFEIPSVIEFLTEMPKSVV